MTAPNPPLIRQAILAGRFYDGNPQRLRAQVRDWLDTGAERTKAATSAKMAEGRAPWGLMLPHAGHVYCGNVLGATLKGVTLPRTLVIICPNHTGRGQAFGVWPSGAWLTPLGAVPVNQALATALIAQPPFAADVQSHAGEHSIEVLLPFVQEAAGATQADACPAIVPVCVGTQNFAALTQAGQALAEVLRQHEDIGVIVSSDMNHFADVETTNKLDQMALDKALAAEPRAFLETIQRERISMCGAGPLTLALTAMHCLGTPGVEYVCHDTSATASGDGRRVVGYAGLRLFVE